MRTHSVLWCSLHAGPHHTVSVVDSSVSVAGVAVSQLFVLDHDGGGEFDHSAACRLRGHGSERYVPVLG